MRWAGAWLGTGLARRLASWAIAITVGTLTLGMIAGIGVSAWSAQRQADADARAAAERLAALLAGKLTDIDAALATLGRSSLVANGLSDSSALDETVLPLLRDHSVSQRYRASMMVCDAYGHPVVGAATPSPVRVGGPQPSGHDARCGNREDYGRALASGQPVARLHDGRDGAALMWIVPVRLPITGTHEGAVVASVPMGVVLQSSAGPNAGLASLMTAGEALATVVAEPGAPRVDRLVTAPLDLSGARSLAGLQLQARVSYESATAAVPWGRIVSGYAAGALLLATLAGIAAVAMARRLTAPLEAIGRLAASDQGGDPAAWAAAAVRPDEAGLLAQRLRDLTERLAQQRLELDNARRSAVAANAAKTEFLATMSHELRTPLNAVTGLAALALDARSDERQGYLEQLRRSAQQLRLLIDDVLDLSRIESGRLEIAAVPCAVAEVINAVRDATLATAMAKGLELRLEIDPGVPAGILADPLRLAQVLVNLIGNAIKFTERGEVRLRALRSAEGLRFEIRDTGIGIAPDDLPIIFEAFRQADASTARRFGGSGLGLAICRKLVDLMKGRIDVNSTLGEGSCFTVTLPLQAVELAAQPPSAQGDRPGELRARLAGRAVLVAEDDDVNRLLTTTLLSRLGLTALEARSGDETLRLLRAPPHPVGLVLMDCHMPGLDGFEATRHLRADPALCNLPVIACTANVLTEDRESCRAAGMDGYVSKPIDRDALVMAMLQCLDEREPQAAAA